MGTFILIYGIFRIGVVFFLGMFWDDFMNEYVIESILAFLIGTSYVFGGMMILAGYRNGCILCLERWSFPGCYPSYTTMSGAHFRLDWTVSRSSIHLFLLSILYDSTLYRSWSLHQSSRMDGQKVFSESLTTHPRPRRILERRKSSVQTVANHSSSSGILWKGPMPKL